MCEGFVELTICLHAGSTILVRKFLKFLSLVQMVLMDQVYM